MSMATRCPACGTVFRVVEDQLKVSEGWVRCGRCCEVFNAVEGLFDLEATVAVPASVQDEGADATPIDAASPPAPGAAAAPPPAHADEPESDLAAAAQRPAIAHTAAAAHVSAGLAPPSDPIESDAMPGPQAAVPDLELPDALATLQGADANERAPTPEFVRRADREARWRHPAMRGALVLIALLLSISLAAQLAWHFRDDLAASWPRSRPWLALACEHMGCRIEAPRRIESLSVDASGLSRVANGALYQLSVVLHNRSAVAVRMPAIELALTDSRGRTTVRRVLYPSELGEDAAALPPRAEIALAATLDIGDRPVAGYTVELFYP